MNHYQCIKSLLTRHQFTSHAVLCRHFVIVRRYNTDHIHTNTKLRDKSDTNFREKIRNFLSLIPSNNLLNSLKEASDPTSNEVIKTLKEIPQTELIDLLENKNLNLIQKAPVFKESFQRCRLYDSDTLFRIIKYFISSQVYEETILILVQVLLSKSSLSEMQLINLVSSLFDSPSNLLEVVTPALIVIFRKIESSEIPGSLIEKMWSRLNQKLKSRELQALARYLMPITITNIASLSNAELKHILGITSQIKMYSNNFLKLIINDVIVNRVKDSAPLTRLLSQLIHNMVKSTYYDEKALDVFAGQINQEINENNFEIRDTIFPFLFAKINHPIPSLLHRLVNLSYEKFRTPSCYPSDKMFQIELRRCILGCAMFNYFPQKLTNILFSDESINYAMKQYSSLGLSSYSVQMPQIYYSALSSGVDLNLSKENVDKLNYISMHCCRESWITSVKFGSPWELRVMYTLNERFYRKLYREWPTLASYRIDGCLFFDKNNNLINLANAKFYDNRLKAFKMFSESGLPAYLDDVNTSINQFTRIWNTAISPETYKGVEKKIAIEMLGPSHYLQTRDGDFRLEGVNVMRINYLKAIGWKVLKIPFYEYKSFTTNKEFLHYFQLKLNNILAKD